MGRIGRSWKLMKTSFGVIKKDKEILIFPILSMIVSALIVISFFTSFFFLGGPEMISQPWVWVVIFVIYLLLYFVVIFFNTAVIGCAHIRLNGGDPTVHDGFQIATQHIGKIFQWAVISATVGVILKAVRQRHGLIGKILAGVVGFAWTYVTFFIIPVLIYEEKGVLSSIKRSADIFKRTWGETFIGSFGFGIIFGLLGLLGLIPIFLGVVMTNIYAIVIGFFTAFIYWIILGAVASATNGVYVAALYQFATKRELPSEFDASTIPQPIS